MESLLEHSRKPSVEDLRRVYRFLNFYTTKFSVKFKTFGIKNFYEDDIRARHSSELLPGNDSSLDRLCDHVLKGTNVFPVPSREDQSRTMEIEDRFLGIQLQEIQGFRKYLAREADTVARSATEHKIAAVVNEKFNPLGSRGDLKRQRISGAVREYGWSSESGDFEAQRAALRAVISNLTEEFVFLPWHRFTYQESVLSSALELLTGPEKRNAVGFGVWVRDGNGRIDRQIFGKEDPPVALESVAEPALEDPLALLGLSVFRKSALLKLLEHPAPKVREALAALTVHETRVALVITS